MLYYMMQKFLNPPRPVRRIITGPSNIGEPVFLTKIVLNFTNEHVKKYIYSPSLHQELYQKLNKCFNNYISIHRLPNFLIEEDRDEVISEIPNDKDFEKSDTET